jgi:hypothetical protein
VNAVNAWHWPTLVGLGIVWRSNSSFQSQLELIVRDRSASLQFCPKSRGRAFTWFAHNRHDSDQTSWSLRVLLTVPSSQVMLPCLLLNGPHCFGLGRVRCARAMVHVRLWLAIESLRRTLIWLCRTSADAYCSLVHVNILLVDGDFSRVHLVWTNEILETVVVKERGGGWKWQQLPPRKQTGSVLPVLHETWIVAQRLQAT